MWWCCRRSSTARLLHPGRSQMPFVYIPPCVHLSPPLVLLLLLFTHWRLAGIAGVVVLPVAGVVGGAVQVGRGIANQSEAIREKKAGKIWNKVRGL